MSSENLKETDLVYSEPQRTYDASLSSEKTAKIYDVESAPPSAPEMMKPMKPAVREKYPKIVFLIILNEFCERFSYYGLRTILFIYLTGFIRMESNTATAIYHSFTVLCYFSPLLGAIIADGYIGLYRTILYVSCLYCVGEIVLTLTSIPALGAPNVVGPMIGLVIIAIGTGGIKPCVSAFGGNQFGPGQKKYLETFFSIFYLSINIGSTISTLITPIFRNDVKCFGHDCYALAFGVPALAMCLSIIFFVIGTPFYKRDDEKNKNGKNIITQTVKCIFTAAISKLSHHGDPFKKDHWLDYAQEKFDVQLIKDVKALLKVLFVFLPLPIFWALYDQQGSRWTMQAQQLNGRIGSSFTIKPDQFQAINPIIVVFMVPFFDFIIYPLFAKINLLKRQLQRMSVGLVFGIAAFVIAAVLESRMQAAVLSANPPDQIRVLNLSPCPIQLDLNKSLVNLDVSAQKPVLMEQIVFASGQNQAAVSVSAFCSENVTLKGVFQVNKNSLPQNLLVYIENGQLMSEGYGYDNKKIVIGYSLLKYDAFRVSQFDTLDVSVGNNIVKYHNVLNVNSLLHDSELYVNTSYNQLDYADYDLTVRDSNQKMLLTDKIVLETCTSYSILFYSNPKNSSVLEYMLLTDVHASGIHIGWQLIQILVMTIGEIMFSISGISFAYSQAPASMKSVLQAIWCMTVAFGNLIVVIIAEGKFIENQVHEYFLFAGLLGVATIAFSVLSFFYKYHDPKTENDEKSDVEESSTGPNAVHSKNSIDSDVKLLKIKSLDSE